MDSITSSVEQAEHKAQVKDELAKKLEEMFKEAGESLADEESEEVTPSRPPLEEAIDEAIFAAGEIQIYASYGRGEEAARMSRELVDKLTALKEKHREQTEMMDILRTPLGVERD